jgi:hypothetical protein
VTWPAASSRTTFTSIRFPAAKTSCPANMPTVT